MSNTITDLGYINETCDYCGCSPLKSYKLTKVAYSECPKCKKKQHFKQLNPTTQATSNKIIIECPYCHSTNTRKISGTTKVATVATFGIFGLSKATKEWHCNNCKSNF